MTATALTSSNTDAGSSAAAGAISSGPSQFAEASIFGRLDFGSLIGGHVFADDEREFGNFASIASIQATWTDTIVWTGPGPAPSSLFLGVTLDGDMMGQLNSSPEGRSISGSALVRIQDAVSLADFGVLSYSSSQGLGRFSVSDAIGVSRDGLSDTYTFSVLFQASAIANEGWFEVNTQNTFGFFDVTLADGTSVLDQISFESGLQPSATNPIPEPTSMALFSLGILGAGTMRSCRRNSNSE
ncbi:PEP-CTERM sorting domain-containing protein [Thalassoglobus sp. JC818]|uniref:PEP-CTERM sorting domain-containing protein n=1 Tax=Thalassoglobus sp. JC818 TaxID=3232136 RepID=UPI00345A8073